MKTLNIDTSDLEQVQRPMPMAPPLDAPAKSPFYRSQFPVPSAASADAINNFTIPNIPGQRIVPFVPLALSGATANAVPTAATVPARSPAVPAPTIASPLQSIALGYTFSFNEIRLPLGSTFTIATYRVYRGPSADSSKASVVDSIPHNPTQLSSPVVVQDSLPNGQTA